MNHLISARKPDLVLINKKKIICFVVVLPVQRTTYWKKKKRRVRFFLRAKITKAAWLFQNQAGVTVGADMMQK